MAGARIRRGRPKGSGIDDRERLRHIAELMLADPALRPTTAIKSMGVTDPSTIRRLRDKFQEARADLMPGAGACTGRVPDLPSEKSAAGNTGPGAVLTSSHKAGRSSRSLTAAAPGVHEASSDPKTWLAMWYGIGLKAMGVAIETQLSLVQQAMRVPPLASAVRSQMALGQMAVMTLCLPCAPRRVLH